MSVILKPGNSAGVADDDLRLDQSIHALTDESEVDIDLSTGNNFSLSLLTATGASRELQNPTNMTVGQSGVIYFIQDGTGGLSLTFDTYYKFEGGTAPTLTTDANAVDRMAYVIRSSSFIDCVFANDIKGTS